MSIEKGKVRNFKLLGSHFGLEYIFTSKNIIYQIHLAICLIICNYTYLKVQFHQKEWMGGGRSTHHHDDVIKWKHFPRCWPFVRGIHRSPVKSPLKGQWRGALNFSLICVRINGWVNNRKAGDLRRHRAHYDVTLMYFKHIRFMHGFWCIDGKIQRFLFR